MTKNICQRQQPTPEDQVVIDEFVEYLQLVKPREGEDRAAALRRVIRGDPERWCVFLNVPLPTLRAQR